MIKVFIWDYKNLDMVGHASLEVKGHYISWWPNTETGVPDKTINHLPIGLRNKFNLDESIFSAMPIFKRTFNDDKKSEKRGPDRVIIIKGLDEKSIILWWKTFGASAIMGYITNELLYCRCDCFETWRRRQILTCFFFKENCLDSE